MAWVQSVSPSFTARHDSRDADDAALVLEQLETVRERLGSLFERTPGDVAVVVHGSDLQIALAHPLLPVARLCTAPAARRYLVGWCVRHEIHVLAPRVLADRASNVPGSLEMLMLSPSALYARLAVGTASGWLPPPYRPRSVRAWLRWAWLAEGAAQLLSGQTEHARPAIARRLREGPAPSFPPGVRDAALLGGTLLDLLAREEGERAVADLFSRPRPRDAGELLTEAFGGRSPAHTERTWRSHLERLAQPA